MRKRQTGIICTIGPACETASILRGMIGAGMDVARFNFSHGTHDEHRRRLRLLRRLAKRMGKRVAALQDLAGYRVRVGRFHNGIGMELRKHRTIFLTNRPGPGGGQIVPFDYEGPLSDIPRGAEIFIDDGNIVLTARALEKDFIRTEVVVPGFLKERKGINIPKARLRFEGFTKKDREDLEFGMENGFDWVAQSFVRNAGDLAEIRGFLRRTTRRCQLIAKIESREGICHIDEILKASDGIMVARGDMGVALPIHEVPMVQKMMIKKANRRRRFVITATQMLESMTENLRPTRAEVSDVANAILDGTDYVMLSAETAAGRFPVQAVSMMSRIASFTETSRRLGRTRYCSL